MLRAVEVAFRLGHGTGAGVAGRRAHQLLAAGRAAPVEVVGRFFRVEDQLRLEGYAEAIEHAFCHAHSVEGGGNATIP